MATTELLPPQAFARLTDTLIEFKARIYLDTIADLKAIIESQYGSIKAFAEETEIDRFNLSKVFSGYDGKEMSVGLFLRICLALGFVSECVIEDQLNYNMSLKDYLMVDNNAIMRAVLMINRA